MGGKGTAWPLYSLVVNENLSPSLRPLSALPLGERSVVEAITDSALLSRRLLEIGCIEGAAVEVVAVMWPGQDPLAVRIGGSTFAFLFLFIMLWLAGDFIRLWWTGYAGSPTRALTSRQGTGAVRGWGSTCVRAGAHPPK